MNSLLLRAAVMISSALFIPVPPTAEAVPPTTMDLQGITISLESEPNPPSPNRETLYSLTAAQKGAPLSNLTPRLEAVMPAAQGGAHAAHGGGGKMPSLGATLSPTEQAGTYEARLVFPMEGKWELRLAVSPDSKSPATFFSEDVRSLNNWVVPAGGFALLLAVAFLVLRGKRHLSRRLEVSPSSSGAVR